MREDHELKELNKGSRKLREKKNSDKGRIKTEKVIMLASAVMLLSGLTATGVYLRANQNSAENVKIDLTGMEEKLNEKASDILEQKQTETLVPQIDADLDYDPGWKENEVPSQEITNQVSGTVVSQTHVEDIEAQLDQFMVSEEPDEIEEVISEEETIESSVSTNANKTGNLTFGESSQLAWPIVGPIIMDYSMDATVYYETLDQYRYQPGMVIGANEGDTITAAANCQISKIEKDSVLGTTVTMNLGNGYELIYGQLDQIKVSENEMVKAGEIIGSVATPTKYYSLEGPNLYIEVRKDGSPINPMTLLP